LRCRSSKTLICSTMRSIVGRRSRVQPSSSGAMSSFASSRFSSVPSTRSRTNPRVSEESVRPSASVIISLGSRCPTSVPYRACSASSRA
jgi:hypothetical protein